jgi:hypothetical protein
VQGACGAGSTVGNGAGEPGSGTDMASSNCRASCAGVSEKWAKSGCKRVQAHHLLLCLRLIARPGFCDAVLLGRRDGVLQRVRSRA